MTIVNQSEQLHADAAPVVGIDLRHITRGASGGITPLIAETVKALHKLAPRLELHIFGTMFNQDVIEIKGDAVTHHTLPLQNYYQALQQVIDKNGIDVLLRAFPNDDDLAFPLNRQIILIPDLQHEYFPDFFNSTELDNRRRNFARLIAGCGAVATISEHAEATIRARYQNARIFQMSPSSQICDAVHEEVSPEFRARIERLQPFFYYPANLWPHKNHGKLLEGFHRFKETPEGRNFKLLLSGHPAGWEDLASAHPSEDVTHIGFVSKAELVHLYRHAEALTFVSLFEGFGIPVLEAFGTGCPVICSNTTSLPEVAGGAALLCDPVDPGDIARCMAEIASDTKLRQELVSRGNERFGVYSWENAARNLQAALEQVANDASAPSLPEKEVPPAAREQVAMPLVSIVTPSYNQGRFLRRTIDSVLNQTYPNIEYVVMDGGSTDESVDILKSYGDRFRWVSEGDRGQTNAINKGLATCSGQILAYLNSDDTLEPRAIEQVVAFFNDHPDVDFVYGLADYIDADDARTGEYATADYSFDRLVEDCCVCQPAAFWRARVPQTIGVFDEALDYTMDYDYWLRIGAAGLGVRHLRKKLAHSRLYPETKTMSARGAIYAEIFAISLKHAGRVSRSYVQGYWNHRVKEREDAFARFVRRVPVLERVFVEYDAFRFATPGRTHVGGIAHIARKVARALRQRVRMKMKRAPALAVMTDGVAGVFADNWLAPRVQMSPSLSRARRLVIEGTAPKPMRVRIESNGRVLAEQSIPAGTISRLSFEGTDELIRLTFDDFIVDEGKRKLSFLVRHTNCFAEHEI